MENEVSCKVVIVPPQRTNAGLQPWKFKEFGFLGDNFFDYTEYY
jgi:hypothetical protein